MCILPIRINAAMNSKVICVFVVDDLYQGLSLLNKALNSNIMCVTVGADRYP